MAAEFIVHHDATPVLVDLRKVRREVYGNEAAADVRVAARRLVAAVGCATRPTRGGSATTAARGSSFLRRRRQRAAEHDASAYAFAPELRELPRKLFEMLDFAKSFGVILCCMIRMLENLGGWLVITPMLTPMRAAPR